MTLTIAFDAYATMLAHLRHAYPNEGAGLLLGRAEGTLSNLRKTAKAVLPLPNRFEAGDQHHRYMITAQDMLDGERTVAQLGLDVIGIFHSHPDHPAQASEYDRELALPWYSYLIVSLRDGSQSVEKGSAADARAWVLADDRAQFVEEVLEIESNSD